MSYPIPEDLKDTYDRAKFTLTRQLIERIARLEADNKALIEALRMAKAALPQLVFASPSSRNVAEMIYKNVIDAIKQAKEQK